MALMNKESQMKDAIDRLKDEIANFEAQLEDLDINDDDDYEEYKELDIRLFEALDALDMLTELT